MLFYTVINKRLKVGSNSGRQEHSREMSKNQISLRNVKTKLYLCTSPKAPCLAKFHLGVVNPFQKGSSHCPLAYRLIAHIFFLLLLFSVCDTQISDTTAEKFLFAK